MAVKLRAKQRLTAAMLISFAFFVTELAVAFKTGSLALMADSFHYMNDLLSFSVALSAILISERPESPQWLTFGWQRAQTLGAFFNGVFLLTLGLSILFQSIERFIVFRKVENVKLILIMGCVGLALNIISACFLHEHHGHGHSDHHHHDHGTTLLLDRHKGHLHAIHNKPRSSPPAQRDIGMMGVMIHVIGDAINNVGIIVASLFMWFLASDSKYYADPGVSVVISLMIFMTALPLVKISGAILLQGSPLGMNLANVKHDLEKIPGIDSIHELHIWRLDQKKTVASAHVVVSSSDCSRLVDFMDQATTIRECLHAYGIHSVTLQPEFVVGGGGGGSSPSGSSSRPESCSLLPASVDAVSVETAVAVPDGKKMRQVEVDNDKPPQGVVVGSDAAHVTGCCRMVCGGGGGNCASLMCCSTDTH
ncbi:cation efflux family protein [Rhypophila decipiens]|uniref:Cation efflux family protein n=1 Tax=Rhypophila decipiens TaxID=261697 RepID=A0AAN7B291_9PEZI|nr:cation efflux family protein [Rhypophila decipiens]